jgi:TRAP-type C4-dicarboxylate transport system substrate-binding protein
MKKLLFILLVLILPFALFAKGEQEAPKYPTPEKPLVLKGGLVPPPHAPQTKSCFMWSDYVKKATNGAIVIEVFPAEQLGVERVLLENANLGTIDWTYVGPGGAERLTPEFGMFDAAYAVQGRKHLRNSLFNREFVNYMDGVISKNSNVNFLGFGWVGSRHVLFNKPVRTPEEAAGLKLRVPDVPMYKIAAQAIGCTPTPISYGESYMAMSQGVVDGAEGPYQGIHDVKWYEVRKVVTETSHVESLGAIFMNKSAMAKMSTEQQKIVRDNAFKAMVDSFEIALKQDNEYKEKLLKFGVQFITLTDEQKQVIVKRAQALLEKDYIPKWGSAWKVFSDLAK